MIEYNLKDDYSFGWRVLDPSKHTPLSDLNLEDYDIRINHVVYSGYSAELEEVYAKDWIWGKLAN